MNARMRRLISDFEQIKKDFSDHKNIIVEAVQGDPPEKYRVTYFLNGIYLLHDGRIEPHGKHVVEITLHAEYPRYKPICRILTPIWHPNFRDGQICIGDIWGAGESLSDIIINIGDMIQYKSWNSFSPLSADAAKWAMENKHLFPVGNENLWKAETGGKVEEVEIDLFELGEESSLEPQDIKVNEASVNIKNQEPVIEAKCEEKTEEVPEPIIPQQISEQGEPNAEPSPEAVLEEAAKAQTGAADENAIQPQISAQLPMMDFSNINDFEITPEELVGINFIPTAQRMQNIRSANIPRGGNINFKTIFMKGILYGIIGGILGWIINELVKVEGVTVLKWMGYPGGVSDLYNLSEAEALAVIHRAVAISSSIFSCIIGGSIGALLGLGEGVYYGSKEKALKYTFVGLGISIAISLVGGYFAQRLYTNLIKDVDKLSFYASLVRAIAWSIMGLGAGVSVGLIKPGKIRLLNCTIGGLIGGFFGGFGFNYIYNIATLSENDTGTVPRLIGIVVMGILIGLGIGLLEQFAKSAWLKVIRGEFEGKEYLVFAGSTTIGNNGKNTIVLFKDKLVAPCHCEIILEGNKYVLLDKGSPMGTIVNGMRIQRHILRQGDAIALGNSVLIFNTK